MAMARIRLAVQRGLQIGYLAYAVGVGAVGFAVKTGFD